MRDHLRRHGWKYGVAVCAIAIAACGSGGISGNGGSNPAGSNPSAAASAAASLANNPNVVAARKLIKHCIPTNVVSLVTGGLSTAEDCIIPEQARHNPTEKSRLKTFWGTCVSIAGRQLHVLKIGNHAGRLQFMEGTDPTQPSLLACTADLVAMAQGVAYPLPLPSGMATPSPLATPTASGGSAGALGKVNPSDLAQAA